MMVQSAAPSRRALLADFGQMALGLAIFNGALPTAAHAAAAPVKLVVFGEQFWRPYIHVRDMARGVAAVCDASEEKEDDGTDGIQFDELLTSRQTLSPVVSHLRAAAPGSASEDGVAAMELMADKGWGYSSTRILPIMRSWQIPQNSLQTMVNSPLEVGVMVRT